MKEKIVSYLTIVAYVVMVSVNALANILPINQQTTKEVSDHYNNLFTPAGITFSIWGVIYLLLFIYVVFQFRELKKPQGKNFLVKVNYLFIVNALLNSLWIFMWHYEVIWFCLIIMIGLLVTLIVINQQLFAYTLSKKENLKFRLPFEVYLGWITIAFIANVVVFLVSINWNGFNISAEIWTNIVLMLAVIIGLCTMMYFKSVAYGLVLIWANFGIMLSHLSATGYNGQYTSIITTIAIVLGILVIGEVMLLHRSKYKCCKQEY